MNKQVEFDVTIDRSRWIGGSDLPAIMGISKFKTRYQLLLEKAELVENDFSGNSYTEYGNKIEPKIRAYINAKYNTTFEPNQVIEGMFRGHTDGFNGACVLEIKSTSHVYETVDEYQSYLVQLVKYMSANKVKKGILAVYHRPDDFDPEFDPERLQDFVIDIKDYQNLLNRVDDEIARFEADLARLKENPLLAEQDFQPNELVVLSKQALVLEQRMAEFKTIEKQYKDMKQALFEAMQRYDVKSWQMPNGTRITKVDGSAAVVETVMEFDVDAFKQEHAELFEKYQKTVTKKKSGRAGYVRITTP